GNAGCITCHSLEPDRVLVGPSMAGIATRAGTRVPGVAAADYIRTSILEPSSYVVDGFAEGQMRDVWADSLSDAQVDALVE
ncbi:MAG: c-type cytochrome, partial [Gemmatimonadales bacterium]|nr:c-type cytochrome [Gemmatimonadales bacterium]